MSFDQYSETPASNYITGYFLTGMAPSSVKVAGSDIMADLASRFAAMHTTGGTATAYTVTQTRQFGSLVNGLEIIVLPNATNTGAATFAPDGLTAKNVFANGVAAIAGMIVQNVPAYLKYDGTQWNLLNPQKAKGSATLTYVGGTTSPTVTANYNFDGYNCSFVVPGGLSATSNSTFFSVNGLPSFLAPASNQSLPTYVLDNGAASLGAIGFIAGSSIINLAKGSGYGIGTSSFTSTGTKGWPSNGSSGTQVGLFIIQVNP